ncbi:hypothetical protein BH23ACT9_BH23ACT9_03080 [soil metagenome]
MAVVALALAVGQVGCATAGSAGDDLVGLVAAVPAEVAGTDLLLRRGPDGVTLLAQQLGIEPAAVRASLTTAAPALRLLRTDATRAVADTLAEGGLIEETAAGDWRLFVRPQGLGGFVGVPAVAIGPGLVAIGGREELRAVASGGAPLAVAAGALREADVALVRSGVSGPSMVAGSSGLPAFASAVLTVDATGQAGRLALQLDEPGAQADAVALAVQVRTAGPIDRSGTAVLQPGAPLTAGDVVTLPVRWEGTAGTPGDVLASGLAPDLLGFLAAR